MAETRIESDSMGDMIVPAGAYWGAQTQRAVENFPISGYRFGRPFILAMGLIKRSAARVNRDLGRIEPEIADLIERAANEVIEGKLDDHFVVDIFQTGSGTSTNMNTNEVVSNRAIELAGGTIGTRDPVHPNDHVNYGQSSNDTIPTAIHVSAATSIQDELIPALEHLAAALDAKAAEFHDVIKIGRTHLQDATPIRLGQEFSGYTAQVTKSVERARRAIAALRELPIGGTAVGTGINTDPTFGARVSAEIAQSTGIPFVEAPNHFEAQAAKDGALEASGELRTIAISLTKVANDIRWLGSGPRCGLGEIAIPSTQPGSSIMPGKVNPVMSEMLIQVGAQVIGHDAAIAVGARDSIFELNVMMPLIARNLLESIRLLATGARVFADRCVVGITANEEHAEAMVEKSLAMVTSLAPIIGYDKAAAIAKESFTTGRPVREIAREKSGLSEEELAKALDPSSMTEPS